VERFRITFGLLSATFVTLAVMNWALAGFAGVNRELVAPTVAAAALTIVWITVFALGHKPALGKPQRALLASQIVIPFWAGATTSIAVSWLEAGLAAACLVATLLDLRRAD
jgi:hypothetical protein